MIEVIVIDLLNLSKGTQIRIATCEEAVQRYCELMETEEGRLSFPPIIVYRDSDGEYWIADGHHRIKAAIRRKLNTIVAEVREGSRADALWESVRANAKNGIMLTKADLHNAMVMLVKHTQKSNVAIAELIGFSDMTIKRYRDSISGSTNVEPDKTEKPEKSRRVGKDGKSYPSTTKKTSPPKAEPPRPEPAAKSPVSPPVAARKPEPPKPIPAPPAAPAPKPVEPQVEKPNRERELRVELREHVVPKFPRFQELRRIVGEAGYQRFVNDLFGI